MEIYVRKLLFILLVGLCVSCAGQQTPDPDGTISKAVASSTCNIYEASGWQVRLDKIDGAEGKYHLKITGEINLPSPGHAISWKMGITDRAHPPGQRIKLIAKAPSETIAAQVITPKTVTFQQDVPHAAYRHISIFCGERLLGKLENVRATD